MSTPDKTRAITGFVLLGVAAATIVVMPILMRIGYRDVRAGETFRVLFVSKAHEPALRRALARYRERVRRACVDRISAAP